MPKAFASDASKNSMSAIILFHGFGANAWDLASIAEYYQQCNVGDTHRNYVWIFPQGFLNLAGLGMDYNQRAWFPIALERLMSLRSSTPDVLSEQIIPSSQEIFSNLKAFVDSLSQLEVQKIILGGFSQGATVAYHLLPLLVREKNVLVEGLVLFSTVSIDFHRYHNLWSKNVEFQSLKFLLQSHGKNDELLAFSEGKKLFSYLSPFFQQNKFIEFYGGHALPENVLTTFFTNL